MKTIIYDMDWNSYNFDLTPEQVNFAKRLMNENILSEVKVIDEMEWEEIEHDE